MSLVDITIESLAAQIGKVVPESYLLIAKNAVLGLDAYAIADILGVEVNEVKEIEEDQDYKAVRLIVAATHNQSSVDRDLSWDELERITLQNLVKRASTGNMDTDTNLRIAALANRATRRHLPSNRTLDAGAAGGRVGITLTKRVIEKLTGQGAERITESQVSLNGTENPSFSEIDSLLGVSNRARTAANLSFKVTEAEPEQFDPNDLDALMEESMKRLKR